MFFDSRENRHTRGDAKDGECKRDQISQLHKILKMTDNPLFISVSSLLCIMKLLFSETLCFKGFQIPFRNAPKTHVECL